MTTEPHVKGKNTLAGFYGASASSVAFLLVLVYVALTPVVPGDDGSIRGAAIMVGFIPAVWVVLFLYFFSISFKSTNRLKFALIFQSIWVACLSCLLAYVALDHEGWSVALPVFALTFTILSAIVGIGAWCSTFAK
ncbi:hypothetical protein [Agaribacterium sp. ZY112]|uniref:hypothetical protein n=1 Tax=Agaribacterium sp. ZY112 TaxID=3233574 RepID=UPI00352344BE